MDTQQSKLYYKQMLNQQQNEIKALRKIASHAADLLVQLRKGNTVGMANLNASIEKYEDNFSELS